MTTYRWPNPTGNRCSQSTSGFQTPLRRGNFGLDGAEVRAVDADISEPVIFGERSLARKTARSATSWGVMNRPVGCKLGDNEARFLPADLGHREESAIGESTRERRPCHGGRAATSGAR
jgi:hypothetical protein